MGTTPGAAVISAFFVHLYLLTTSGASPSCFFVQVRYQAEGVESKKESKKKMLGRPTNPMQNGGGARKGVACLAQFYKNFFMGSRSLDLERIHCFISSCFSFISLGCVFPESAALYTDYYLDTVLGLVKGGGRVGVCVGRGGGASVVKWNKSHCLSGVCCCCSPNVS